MIDEKTTNMYNNDSADDLEEGEIADEDDEMNDNKQDKTKLFPAQIVAAVSITDNVKSNKSSSDIKDSINSIIDNKKHLSNVTATASVINKSDGSTKKSKILSLDNIGI